MIVFIERVGWRDDDSSVESSRVDTRPLVVDIDRVFRFLRRSSSIDQRAPHRHANCHASILRPAQYDHFPADDRRHAAAATRHLVVGRHLRDRQTAPCRRQPQFDQLGVVKSRLVGLRVVQSETTSFDSS